MGICIPTIAPAMPTCRNSISFQTLELFASDNLMMVLMHIFVVARCCAIVCAVYWQLSNSGITQSKQSRYGFIIHIGIASLQAICLSTGVTSLLMYGWSSVQTTQIYKQRKCLSINIHENMYNEATQ